MTKTWLMRRAFSILTLTLSFAAVGLSSCHSVATSSAAPASAQAVITSTTQKSAEYSPWHIDSVEPATVRAGETLTLSGKEIGNRKVMVLGISGVWMAAPLWVGTPETRDTIVFTVPKRAMMCPSSSYRGYPIGPIDPVGCNATPVDGEYQIEVYLYDVREYSDRAAVRVIGTRSSPWLDRVEPSSVEPGHTVTLRGLGFTKDAWATATSTKDDASGMLMRCKLSKDGSLTFTVPDKVTICRPDPCWAESVEAYGPTDYQVRVWLQKAHVGHDVYSTLGQYTGAGWGNDGVKTNALPLRIVPKRR